MNVFLDYWLSGKLRISEILLLIDITILILGFFFHKKKLSNRQNCHTELEHGSNVKYKRIFNLNLEER